MAKMSGAPSIETVGAGEGKAVAVLLFSYFCCLTKYLEINKMAHLDLGADLTLIGSVISNRNISEKQKSIKNTYF